MPAQVYKQVYSNIHTHRQTQTDRRYNPPPMLELMIKISDWTLFAQFFTLHSFIAFTYLNVFSCTCSLFFFLKVCEVQTRGEKEAHTEELYAYSVCSSDKI